MTRFRFSSKFIWSLIVGSTLMGTGACGASGADELDEPSGSGAAAGAGSAGSGGSSGAGATAGSAGAAGSGAGATVIQDPDLSYALDVDAGTKLDIAVGDVLEVTDDLGARVLSAKLSVSGYDKIARYELKAREVPAAPPEVPSPKWSFSIERTDGMPTSEEGSFDGTRVQSIYRLGGIERHAGNRTDEMQMLLDAYAEGAFEESPELQDPSDRRWQRHPLTELGLSVLERLSGAELTSIAPARMRLAFDAFGPQVRRMNPEWAFEPAEDWKRELFGLDENDQSIVQIANEPVIVVCPFPTAASTQSYANVSNSGPVSGTLTVNSMNINALKRDNVGGLSVTNSGSASMSLNPVAQPACPGFFWPSEVRGSVSADDKIECVGTVCCPNGVEDSAEEVKLDVSYNGANVLSLGGNIQKADATHAATTATGSFSVCYSAFGNASTTHSVQIRATIGP